MKSLIVFADTLLNELGEWCQVSTVMDRKTIHDRVEAEGLSFLTITLADFGKSFEKSLDLGLAARNHFSPTWGFSGGVPKFLSGFLALVFDRKSGTLLESPSLVAIRAIRQFSLVFAKIGVDCSDERVQQAKEKYLECEREVRDSDRRLKPNDKLDFGRVARRLWSDFLTDVDRKVYAGEILPKHGPGATADRLVGNEKYDQWEWTTRLEAEFPFMDFARASWGQYTDLPSVNFREPGSERPVRVITVPKTLKTPRIIAIEPTCMQYMQQAVHEAMVESMRSFHNPRNFVLYDSQVPNQEMARIGSLDGSLATLDLSEASDRVSNQHVRLLLENHPHLGRAVDACRSRKADVDGKVIRLAKFASMGSALCFPFEALVFTTVVFLGIERSQGYALSNRDIKNLVGKVRIYGDDIIVPVEHAESVKSTLELFGFRVNTNKSFWTGRFRESCGRDYYAGYDVSVVKVRKLFPINRRNVEELVSTVSLRNQLAKAGYVATVDWLDTLISKVIPFPFVGEDSPILGRVCPTGFFEVGRMHPDYQYPEVKGYCVSAPLPVNRVDGYAALLKWYLKRGREPFDDINHLTRSGRPIAVNIKHRWASVR